jgi:peptidoglycan/LPS O-acetylase OafA/YrhL
VRIYLARHEQHAPINAPQAACAALSFSKRQAVYSSGMQRPSDPKTETSPEAITYSGSLFLDVYRFTLALLVLVGHVSTASFSTGWPLLMKPASISVYGFFVLSGFMMRHVTATRERTGFRYSIARISRMYSVVIPAIALTLLVDVVARHADPAFLATVPHASDNLLRRAVWNGLFLSQIWKRWMILGVNLPLWSLGYEVPYYVLFGLFTFLRGWRRVAALTLGLALYGPQIAYLLPIWWSGCWLYDLRGWVSKRPRARALPVALAMALLLLWLSVRVSGGQNGFQWIAAIPSPLAYIRQQAEATENIAYASGLLAFAGLYLALAGLDFVPLRAISVRSEKYIRLAGETTFLLYATHLPLLVLAGSLHLYRMDSTPEKIALTVVVVAVSMAAGEPVNRLKGVLRRVLSERLRPVRPLPAANGVPANHL